MYFCIASIHLSVKLCMIHTLKFFPISITQGLFATKLKCNLAVLKKLKMVCFKKQLTIQHQLQEISDIF